jgi:outer membrane protein assembly factor BamB
MPPLRVAPPRSLACLCLLLILLSAPIADAGPLATELVRPNFTASGFEYIDTGGAFLESGNGAFRAAVSNPGKQQARFYLAVLHEPTGTVVWSANRAAPTTSSGRVGLLTQGLTVSDPNGTVLWSTPSPLRSPVAALRLQNSATCSLGCTEDTDTPIR